KCGSGSEDWQRLLAIARHPFDSYIGRVPWVLAPEYRYPETLGRDARIAGDLAVTEVVGHAQRLRDTGVSDGTLRGACGALNLAFAVCAIARLEAVGDLGDPQWVTPSQELSAEIASWDEQHGLIEALAALAGEEFELFSAQLPRRVSLIEQALQKYQHFFFSGFGQGARNALDRIAAEVSDQSDDDDQNGRALRPASRP
ncbi:MAG: hypothetical protein ACRDPY_47650, partial [Streptosporangiaceae bacterium]